MTSSSLAHAHASTPRRPGRPGLLDTLLAAHPDASLDTILLGIDSYHTATKALRQARARGMEPDNPTAVRAHLSALNPTAVQYTLTDEDRAAIRAHLTDSLLDLRTAALLALDLNITPALRLKITSPSTALTASQAVQSWVQAAGITDGFLLRALDDDERVSPFRADPTDLRLAVVHAASRAGIRLDQNGRRWRLAPHDG